MYLPSVSQVYFLQTHPHVVFPLWSHSKPVFVHVFVTLPMSLHLLEALINSSFPNFYFFTQTRNSSFSFHLPLRSHFPFIHIFLFLPSMVARGRGSHTEAWSWVSPRTPDVSGEKATWRLRGALPLALSGSGALCKVVQRRQLEKMQLWLGDWLLWNKK